jgi:predicted aspartyl protease
MIKGEFVENIPLIKIIVSWERAVQTPFVVLDTGFTGDLQVTPKLARELGLQTVGVTKSRIANGQIVNMPTALALATMEGTNKYIQVLISDSMPLLGISFLSKFSYKAIINCRYKTISLRKVNR